MELLRLLRSREISAVALAKEHIREIERLDPRLHAFAHFDPERTLLAAKAADRRFSEASLPLLGLPMTVKSSIATRGYRCETGSVLDRGSIAEKDAAVVERMRAAGAVILGTTNCPEFLMAYESDNLLYGKTCNPWNLAHSAGRAVANRQRLRRVCRRAASAAIAAGRCACQRTLRGFVR